MLLVCILTLNKDRDSLGLKEENVLGEVSVEIFTSVAGNRRLGFA